MRVVQLLPELNEGGVERGVVELNRELVKCGVDSIVISAGGKQAGQIDADGGKHVVFDVVRKNPLSVPLRVLKLREILKELKPDILHARSRVPAWLAFLANNKLQIPFVTTVHGFNSVNAYSRVMTLGDRVICVSSAIKDYVQQHYQVDEEKLAVIPRGIDMELFDPDNLDRMFMDDFSARYGFEGRLVITSAGRITQLKDYETFIRSIDLLKSNYPQVLGLIVGGVRSDKQAYFQGLQKLVRELGLQEHIVFTGSQEKMAEIYRLSRVVISSSKKPESFGRAAAEALAMGVPVAATGHGGILDIVIPEQTGALFAPGDVDGLMSGVQSALKIDPQKLRPFVAENFPLSRMVTSTLNVYRSM